MPNLRLVVMLLMCCWGCGGQAPVESAPDSGVQVGDATTLPGPWSYCVSTCNCLRPQLIRDFGLQPAEVDCLAREFQAATGCQSCTQVLERRFGLQPTACR